MECVYWGQLRWESWGGSGGGGGEHLAKTARAAEVTGSIQLRVPTFRSGSSLWLLGTLSAACIHSGSVVLRANSGLAVAAGRAWHRVRALTR